MSWNRAEVVDRQLVQALEALAREPAPPAADPSAPVAPGSTLTGARLLDLLESQLLCRLVDLEARALRARDQGYYTIGSAGHEGNVVLGALARATDPAFLHYRSGALMQERARQAPEVDMVRDALLGVVASTEEPIAGGRHKVWGSRPLWVPPQTSTIASHLPKAVGAALAIYRAKKLGLPLPVPADSIVLCSFGDASLNHSTAQGALNAAGWTSFQKIPLPLVFVCEDNGIGISVGTPPGWVEASVRGRPGLEYVFADGLDLPAAWAAASWAVGLCRRERRPVFLHLRTVRLLGHAGSDIEQEYRSLPEIEATEAQDPVLATCRLAVARGLIGAGALLARLDALRARVRAAADAAVRTPKLRTAAEVRAPLAPCSPARVAAEAARPAPQRAAGSDGAAGAEGAGTSAPAGGKKAIGRQRHLAAHLNGALAEALRKYPEALVFGEDVARKGGVYHVTTGLWKEFGPGRVFNTLLDEQAILGMALGAGHLGLLPIPEVQYLAYVHNAEDQLRGEAASLQFFSCGQFSNPMVVRIASFAYQKGFGGHFHNDNSVAVLTDVPGLIVCTPSRGDEAVRLLRTALALAKAEGRVVCFLEPIALYMTKDLHEDGDGEWLADFPAPGDVAPLDEGRVWRDDGHDLTIVSYANGLYRSLRAARTLEREHGVSARVVDLRWLSPLPLAWVERQARTTGRCLVVDECRRAGGLGHALVSELTLRTGGQLALELVAAEDTFIPLGPAMQAVLPQEEHIVAAARALAAREAPLAPVRA